tara:strand:- start:8105 stop:8890 length:786 start_codon:yes stop_codon:yes gene_type:complete
MNYFKKSLGQNFLIDKNIIQKILNQSKIKNRHILEIGPGNGELTDEILRNNPSSITLIEKDFKLTKILKEKYSKYKNIKIFNNDILEVNIEKLLEKNTIIFGNLPYNISSQILVKFIKFKKWPPRYLDLIFMFQKELGDKIMGIYKSSNYSRLSILTSFRLNIVNKFLVSPNCFKPKPKINSIVIHFKPKKNNLIDVVNISKIEKVTNIFFSNKRKMINKNLRKILTDKEINMINGLNIKSRPSELSPEMYYKIAELSKKV